MWEDDDFARLVDRVLYAAGSPQEGLGAEALVLAAWLRHAEEWTPT